MRYVNDAEDAPKSFHAFRQAKKAGGEKWEKLQYSYNHTLTNAVGERIIKVKQDDVALRGVPNAITQTTSKNGGINRNYYDKSGRQSKQISNNHHNHKAVMGYGKQGEHAHDYVYNSEEKLISRLHRELNDEERKENSDVL